MNHVILNGKSIPKTEAQISVFNKSMFFGFAVYESVKVIQGKAFATKYHAERLFDSARAIGLEHTMKQEDVAKWIEQLIHVNQLKDALIRLLLVGPESPSAEPQLFLFSLGLTFYPDAFYKKGAKVVTYNGERFLPEAKTNNLLLNYLAYREAEKADAMDALLVNRDGNILEGTRTNFFAVKGRTIITSPKEFVLGGITKKILAEVVQPTFKLKEAMIPLKNIESYDGFFLTSTSMNVMPVTQINDVKLPGVSPAVAEIIKAFKQHKFEVAQ